MEWYVKVLKNYANFQGRARRKEYWMFILFNFLFTIAAFIVDLIIGTVFVLVIIYSIGVIIPNLAVIVRRMHDIGKGGGWFFINFVPLIGGIWFLVLLCTEGTPGENRYGPSPKPLIHPVTA